MRHSVLQSLTLNGEPVEVSFAPYKTLLEVLREDLGHTGTKHGCELGECGACAVLVDGEPRRSSTRCRRRSPTSAARSAATAPRA
jgi:aerobic-type carbon monoxide dehydrogenase small subunit (CoxS/CutS family)